MENDNTAKLEFIKLLIRLGVSAVVLVSGLYVVLSRGYTYPDATTKWAFGVIGVVLGYWLR
jgi:hypothetical protein